MKEIEFKTTFEAKDESSQEQNYFYAAEDDSLIDPFLQKNILAPLLSKVVPWELPANIITIIGNSSMLIAFIIALLSFTRNNYTLWFLIPFLIIFYLINDCLDGGQARKTKTGSPLGEFLDHFLDTFVTAELMIPVLVCYRFTNIYLIYAVLFLSYLAQALAFWERYSLGHMHFSKFGSSEAIISLAFIITLSYFSPLVDFLQIKLAELPLIPNNLFFSKLSISELFMFIMIIGVIISIFNNLNRTKGASGKFWTFVFLSLFVALSFAKINFNYYYFSYYVFCLYCVEYVSALLVSIVDKKKDPLPDFVLPLCVLAMLIMKVSNIYILVSQLVYLSIKIIIRASIFIYNHKQFWVWKNPKLQ